MNYRILGRTGIKVSVLAFGAGPVSGWATNVAVDRQVAVVRRAIEAGINWFDTAPTYSDGQSELSIGRALSELAAHEQVHLATKVRLDLQAGDDIRGFVLRSVESSLERLRCQKVTLLQLHNSITARRGDQPTSVTPRDVLGPRGVLRAFEELRSSGLVAQLGLTGLGDAASLQTVIESSQFDTVQAPYNLLNPSAGQQMPADFPEANYGNLFSHCDRQQMGVFAIRVFAGGALALREPSAHTRVTKFFPMDLYQRDRARAEELARSLPTARTLPEAALQFVLDNPIVTSALIGFASEDEIDNAVQIIARSIT
jgi:aryl-alcohol dehydrogenase-like predicted oxidoreductase